MAKEIGDVRNRAAAQLDLELCPSRPLHLDDALHGTMPGRRDELHKRWRTVHGSRRRFSAGHDSPFEGVVVKAEGTGGWKESVFGGAAHCRRPERSGDAV